MGVPDTVLRPWFGVRIVARGTRRFEPRLRRPDLVICDRNRVCAPHVVPRSAGVGARLRLLARPRSGGLHPPRHARTGLLVPTRASLSLRRCRSRGAADRAGGRSHPGRRRNRRPRRRRCRNIAGACCLYLRGRPGTLRRSSRPALRPCLAHRTDAPADSGRSLISLIAPALQRTRTGRRLDTSGSAGHLRMHPPAPHADHPLTPQFANSSASYPTATWLGSALLPSWLKEGLLDRLPRARIRRAHAVHPSGRAVPLMLPWSLLAARPLARDLDSAVRARPCTLSTVAARSWRGARHQLITWSKLQTLFPHR